MENLRKQMKNDFELMCEAKDIDFSKIDFKQVEIDNLERFKKHLEKFGDISEFEYMKRKIYEDDEHKDYMIPSTNIRLVIDNISHGIDYDFCTYTVFNDENIVKAYKNVAFTQKAFINFHKKIFAEFGTYKTDKNILAQMSDYDYKKEKEVRK